MTSLTETITDAKCEDLHCVVYNGSSKFLCFTRLDVDTRLVDTESFVICVTDTSDLWKVELTKDELLDMSDMNMDAYFSKLRSGFQNSEIQLSQMGVKMNMTIGLGSKSLTVDLYEAKAIDKRTEVQTILFGLADKSKELQAKLDKTNTDLHTLRKRRDADGPGGAVGMGIDLDGVKGGGKNQTKAPAKQVGMSVVNPGSKKRKVARGVDFE